MVDGTTPTLTRRWRSALVCLLGFAALGAPIRAGDEAVGPVARHVLALFDGASGDWRFDVQDPVHEMLELPLNHLGMVVWRHDVRLGPPPAEALRDLRAVVTCFAFTEEPVEWLWPWLLEMRRDPDLRFVHVGEYGPMRCAGREDDEKRLREWLDSFGLAHDSHYSEVPLVVTVEMRDEATCAYEADPREHAIHRGPQVVSGANRPWITTRSRREPGRVRAPVVTGPFGGVALHPYAFKDKADEGSRRWFIDPFAFFAEALGLVGVPAPHPSVLNGRRMFFLHVDGDGFESLSTVRAGTMCGEIFYDEIVKQYPLPFSLSVIVGTLSDTMTPAEPNDAMLLASRILNHQNVEPASHSVRHPLYWTPKKGVPPGRNSLPPVEGFEPSPKAEVRDSLAFIDKYLLRGDRRCRLMFWTGDCCPPAEAIAESYRLGALNLNGGIYRWDRLHDSVGYVAPWSRTVGDQIQVYCGASNEMVYEGFLTNNPGAFGHVDETIERTGAGRILKPANIYIHFYSVDRPGRLRTVKKLLDRWGLREPTAPVFASTYAAAVVSAMRTARIERTGSGWAFRDFGDCHTVRLDAPGEVDWDRSPGVLGARRIGESLYIHLGRPDADMNLVASPVSRPHVLEANHLLTDAVRDPKGVAFTSTAIARRLILLAGFPPDSRVLIMIDGERTERAADEAGILRIEFGEPGSNRVEARLP